MVRGGRAFEIGPRYHDLGLGLVDVSIVALALEIPTCGRTPRRGPIASAEDPDRLHLKPTGNIALQLSWPVVWLD